MALTSSAIVTTNTLEEFRLEFNKLRVDVTALDTADTYVTNIVFEGATTDDYQTTFAVVDPTADRTITLPNLTGTVSLLDATETLTNKTLTTPVIAEIDSGSSITLDATTSITLDAAAGDIALTPAAPYDVNIPANIGLTFGDDGEKIEGDGTDLTIASGGAINLIATTDVVVTATGFTVGSTTVNGTELGYIDGITTGTAAASKAVVLDSSKDITGIRNLTLAGDLTVSGDDLFMATNTSGAALIADGTNFNPVVISGDITIGTSGVAAIGSGVIVNADVNASAAIADSKLDTISTADKVSGAAVQVDGATSGTGITLASTDKFLVDDSGTTKYIEASQINTYVATAEGLASVEDATALAIALG
jgi:hypothetical protein